MAGWIEITTRIGCRIQCVYCPQEKFIKAYSKRGNITQMSFDTFKKCIDKVPKSVGIRFAGFSEPWSNPDCTKMITYAHKCGFAIYVNTTTIGMNLPDIDLIKKIPFKEFHVHIDNKKQTKIKVNEKYLSVINKLLNSNIQNICFEFKQASCGFSDINPKLKKLFKNFDVPLRRGTLTTRASNVKIKGRFLSKFLSGKTKSFIECDRIYKNILLPNGDVVLCCMDWGLNHILGNLLMSDYESLFKSKEFLKIKRGLKDSSSDILCRRCDWAKEELKILRIIKGKLRRLRIIRFIGRFIKKYLEDEYNFGF